VHICFGYAAVIHVRPSGYSFLGELAGCNCRQVSIETAQSNLDCSVLKTLPGKTIILGVIDLNDMTVETPEKVAARIRRALPFVASKDIVVAPDCGMKYLPREVAFEKLKAMVEGAKLMRAELGQTDSKGRQMLAVIFEVIPAPGRKPQYLELAGSVAARARENRRVHLGGALREPHERKQAPVAFVLAGRGSSAALAQPCGPPRGAGARALGRVCRLPPPHSERRARLRHDRPGRSPAGQPLGPPGLSSQNRSALGVRTGLQA